MLTLRSILRYDATSTHKRFRIAEVELGGAMKAFPLAGTAVLRRRSVDSHLVRIDVNAAAPAGISSMDAPGYLMLPGKPRTAKARARYPRRYALTGFARAEVPNAPTGYVLRPGRPRRRSSFWDAPTERWVAYWVRRGRNAS